MESGTRSCKTTAQCDGSGWIVINHQLSEAEFANDGPFSHLGNARTAGAALRLLREGAPR